jgi:cysteine peptidase C11 family protein
VRTHSPRAGRLVALAATLVAAGTAFVATGLGTTGEAVADAADESSVADWTMMVYAVGDTVSVPQLMVENLNEIAQLPDEADVNIVVLLDLPEATDQDAPTSPVAGVGDFSTAKLLVLKNHQYHEVRDLGEVSMGRPDTLAGFVAEAADRFPARHYGFTFFDHGGGNTGGYVDTGPPGAQALTVPLMRQGLISGMQQAGIDRFDVIDQAACLMANYETVHALAPLGKWLAGSEEIMIDHPLAPASFPPMGAGGDGEAVANGFVQGYVDLLDTIATSPGGQAYRDLVAMSVVDGDAVAGLDAAMDSFSQAAIAHMDEITTSVARARAQALEFISGFPGEEGQSADLIDLGDFMKHLTDVPDDVAVARDAVSAAVDRAVTAQATGQGTQQATGINVYLPANPRFVNGDVLNDGTEPQGWRQFVEAFVESASSSQGDSGQGVQFVSQQAQVLQADASGIKIAGQLTDGTRANATAADTYVLAGFGGQQQALGIILPAYLDAGGPGQVQGVWNYALTALTDGKAVAPATAQYQAQSGGLLGVFFAHYTSPTGAESDVAVRELLSSQGDIESVSVVDATSGSAAGVSLDVGGTLTPYVFVPASGGYQPTPSNQSVKITNDLAVGFVKLPKDTQFQMALVVQDASGSSAAASTTGRVQ